MNLKDYLFIIMSDLYLLLFGFIALANASEWPVLEEIESNSYHYNIVSDKKGYAHFAFCGYDSRLENEFTVVYARVNIDTHSHSSSNFLIEAQCRAAHLTVENETVYMTYQLVSECGIGSYACSSLFMNAKVNSSWITSIPVEPPTPSVSFSYNPLIVQDPSTNQVWVAYKSIGKENPTKIKVAYKKKTEKNFSENITVVSTNNQSTIVPGGFSMIRTSGRSMDMLQLAWQVKSEGSSYLHKIYHSRSSDGFTWDTPKVIAMTDLKDHNSPFTLVADEAKVYLVFARIDTVNRGIWISYSEEQGANWTEPVRISMQANYLSVGATVCTKDKRKRLYVLAQKQLLESPKDTLWYQELDTKKVVALGNPYEKDFEDCYNPALACSDRNVMLSCKVRGSDNKHTIRTKNVKL